jgi:hopanoid biosynthesis associated protein HpnK
VITADDFGLAEEVNEAVEFAHRKGVLSAASLMVTGPAAAHALALARRMPNLRLGLHLVLVEGDPALPHGEIAALTGRDGKLRSDMTAGSFRLALDPGARRQLHKEMAAQFAAFRQTGKPLDHVSAHKHYHLHPLIARELFVLGPQFGMRSVRVPVEPVGVLSRAEEPRSAPLADFAGSWARLLKRRARRAGYRTADAVFGLRWSGRMNARRLRALVENAPDGLVEIYMHPATADDFPGHAPGYRYTDELAALVEPSVIDAVKSTGRRPAGYADVA